MESNVVIETKKILGKEKLEVLEMIFGEMTGSPLSINLQRFKADHDDWIELIENIESTDQLIRSNDIQKGHVLFGSTLLLLDNQKAKDLVNVINDIFPWLKSAYKKFLSEPIRVDELLKDIQGDPEITLEALNYMRDISGLIHGTTAGFPYGQDAKFYISEAVLKRKGGIEILEDYFRWHYLNPSKPVTLSSSSRMARHKKSSDIRFFTTENISERPEWFNNLDQSQKKMINEIDEALKSGLCALPVMGVRALIEYEVIKKVGDQGSFRTRLEEFSNKGYATLAYAEHIHSVFDTGSAAIHRGHIPNQDDVKTCIEVIMHFLKGIYDFEQKINSLKNNTPRRNPSP